MRARIVRQEVLSLTASILGVPGRSLRDWLCELGFVSGDRADIDEIVSLIFSELCGAVAEAEAENAYVAETMQPNEKCGACGHTRREHCGCGHECFAERADGEVKYLDDTEIDALIYLWREVSSDEVSMQLSEPKGRGMCPCAGFVSAKARPNFAVPPTPRGSKGCAK